MLISLVNNYKRNLSLVLSSDPVLRTIWQGDEKHYFEGEEEEQEKDEPTTREFVLRTVLVALLVVVFSSTILIQCTK